MQSTEEEDVSIRQSFLPSGMLESVGHLSWVSLISVPAALEAMDWVKAHHRGDLFQVPLLSRLFFVPFAIAGAFVYGLILRAIGRSANLWGWRSGLVILLIGLSYSIWWLLHLFGQLIFG